MRETPLYEECKGLGGKLVDFHGWALPLQFEGIVKEHQHTRARVSIFDCSHMGEFRVHGREAMEHYDALVCSDVFAIPVGRCKYGAILNESGGIIDDAITFRMAQDELYIVTNAGALEKVSNLLTRDASGVEDVSDETAKIDVQGPDARKVMVNIGIPQAEELKYYRACSAQWEGREIVLARLGYTGELGYEIYLPNDVAAGLWRTLAKVDGVKPAGLGARDTLRTEVGFALSGQDFDETNTPLEIGIEGLVQWDGDFTGLESLKAQRDDANYAVLTGIRSKDRRAPRHDFDVKKDGEVVGRVTSGTYGASLGYGVGIAYVPRNLAGPGTALTAGPKDLPIETASHPIYKHGTSRN